MGKSLGLRVVIVALAALVALGCATRYRIETLEPTSDAFHKERIRLLGELQKSPTNASVLYQLGLGFARMNQHRVALNYFDRAHQASPKNAEILMHRGLTAQHLGLRMSAWQDFQRVLELDPTKRQALVKPYAKLLRSVAERFRRYRQFERAIQVIDQLRLLQGKLDASDRLILAEVHFQRARRQIRPHSTDKKALEKAMADLKRADALGLKSAELQLWLGIALLTRGSKREAHKHFDRFTGVPSENVARVERLLTLLRDYGHSAEGIERLQDYLKRHPHAPPRFHRQLGDLLLAAGKNREALSAYESWLKRSGKSSRARLALRLASTMIQKRMYTQAASLFHKAIELEPDDAAPFRLLLIYARQRSSDGSSVRMQAMLDELITKHPRPGWVRSAVGELYREVGDSKRALEYFEQALKATPPYWRALLGIARLQQLAGDRSRRDQAINRWLASQNKNARSYRDAGDLLMELQERDDAMKLYRAGMRSKGDLESMLLRAYVYRLEGEFSKETTEVDGFLRNLTKNSRSSALLAIGRFYLELHDNRPALRYLGQLVSAERDANARQGHLLLGDLYSVQPLRNLSRAAVHYRGYLALTTSDKRKALEKLCAHLDDRSGLQSLQAELFEQLAQYHPNKKAFYLQIGRRFLDRRDGTQALRFMRQYLKLSGGSADERIRVASLFADAKLTSQALQLIRDLPSKLLLKKVSAPGLHRELGDYLRRQGRVADAEAHYRRYLAQNEPDSNEMFRFGNTLSSSQFCDLAVYAYRLSGADTKGLQKGIVEPTKDERLSKKSHYTSSLHRMFMNLGRCYVAIAQPDRAEKAFDAALASRYRSYYYFSSIGGIFFRANYLKKAIKYYEQLYKQKYGSSRYVYRTILDIYIRTGMTDRIPKLVSAYIERHSRSRYYRPHRDIAKLLAEFGLFERAIAILEKARLKKPKDAEYAFYLGQFYLQDGQTAKGMAILRNLTDVSSWGSHAGLRYAEMGLRVLMRRGMFRDALLIADKVLKANPSEARWLLLRGTLYARLGDAVKAKRDIGDALTTQLSLGRSLSSVVGEFRTLRRLDLAIELLNHLRLLNPKRATHLRDLAQLYAENGQIDDAKQSYLEYARLDKNGLLAAARFFRRIGELDRARRLLLKTFDVPRFTQLQQVLIELHDIYSTLGRRNELDSVVNQLVLSQRDKQQAYKLVVAYYQRFYDAEKLRRAQEQLRKYTTHDARLFRAQVLLSEGKFESAMPLLRSLILRRESQSPRRYGFYSRYTRYRYWRRRVYFTLGLSGPQQVVSLVASYGRLDLARELARLAVRSNPSNASFVAQLVELELRSKRPFEAVEAARRFLRSTTSTGDTRTILDVLNRHGLRREAAALLDELAKTKKIDNADARWVRDLAALRLATLEKNDAAIRRLHALLLRESGRDRIKHWIALARFYLSADRNQLALEAAARVMKMGAPRDLSSIYELGVQALVRLRRHDDLDRWNERFVKRSEDRLNAYQLVSRVLAMHHLSKDALRYGHLALQMRRNNAQVLPTLINAALTLPPDDGRRELDRLSRLSSNRFQFWDDVLNRSRRRHRFAYLIDASRRKLEKQPGYTLQLLTSGATALFRGDRAAAKKQFTEYIRRSSGKVRAHLEVGIYYTWSFYLDDAERHLRQCLKLQPSAIEGWIGLFRVALLRGSSDDAIAIAKRAVAEISTPSAILEHLVSVVLQQYPAPDTRVLTQLAAFGRRAPESLPNLVLSALLLARGGDKAQTLAALRRVAHGDTSQGLWSRAIAISLLRNKRIEAGLAALDLYLSGGRTRYERSKRLRVSVGTILLALRLNAETLSNAERGKLRVRGLALIESLRGAERKRETHVVTTAAIYEHGGLPSKAIWLFRGALRQRPSASVYYNNLAYLFARRGHDLEEALRLVRKAARLDPKKRMYYDDTEGWVLFKMGRVRDAKARILGSMRIIDETMQLSDMVEYYYHLALIELKLGNRKAAIWRLRQAANVDGSGIYGLRSRGILLRLLGLRGTRDKP